MLDLGEVGKFSVAIDGHNGIVMFYKMLYVNGIITQIRGIFEVLSLNGISSNQVGRGFSRMPYIWVSDGGSCFRSVKGSPQRVSARLGKLRKRMPALSSRAAVRTLGNGGCPNWRYPKMDVFFFAGESWSILFKWMIWGYP